jgi:Ca-activated chloride channel family protein
MSSINLLYTELYWRETAWLLLALYPLVFIVWQCFVQRSKTQGYADAAVLPWVHINTQSKSYYLRSAAWFFFFLLIAISLAGPRFALQHPAKLQTAQYDIVLLVDVSRSMQSRDIVPSRRERASLELYEFLQSPLAQKSRVAIIVYAARPHLLLPFTQDHNAAQFYLRYLDDLILPTLGSNAPAALALAQDYLRKGADSDTNNHNSAAAIMWLSDGDIPASQQRAVQQQVLSLKSDQIALSILAIGTQDGEAIPLTANISNNSVTQINNQAANKTINNPNRGSDKWLEHQGKVVRSRLNSPLLQQLAASVQGKYSEVQADNSDWQALIPNDFTQTNNANSSNKNSDAKDQQWQELYLYSLLPAVCIFFVLILFPPPSRTLRPKIRHSLNTLLIIGGLGLLLNILIPAIATADNSALQSGINAYREQNYPQAIKQFSEAMFNADNDTARARALHNLGNSYFQYGDYAAAQQVFQDALLYRPNYAATQDNLLLAQTVLYALQQSLAAKNSADESENSLSGSRFESQNNSLDWNQDSTKVWGNNFATTDNAPAKIPLDAKTLQQLVQRGFQRLEEKGILDQSENGKNWQHKQQSLYDARIALQQMDSNPVDLFKRLFEIEEGFYSKQSEPQVIPEVLPW